MRKLAFLFIALIFGSIASAQTFTVDSSKSSLKWTGKKVTGKHFGQISLKSGNFTIEDNKVTSGNFTIDMNSITVDDLQGEWMEKLVGHLKSDDFFGTANFPEAKLVIKESSALVDGNATLKGHLTIKGTTHPIEFSANKNGNLFTAQVTVDRTLYNIRYGSGKFFDNLGDKTIYDDFTLDVKLVTQ